MAMSTEAKFQPDFLHEVLEEAGLLMFAERTVGKKFSFYGDGHFIAGTITSIGYGRKEGVVLYVSTPRYRGMDIRRLERRSGEWIAVGNSSTEVRTGIFATA